MPFRVCVANFPALTEVEGNRITGIFAPVYNLMFERTPNLTLNSEAKLGDLDHKTGLYDGCLGQVQRNESDTHAPTVSFPVIAKGLTESYLSMTSKLVIASAYNNSGSKSSTSVLDAFDSFTKAEWILITVLIMVLALLVLLSCEWKIFVKLLVKKSIRRRRRSMLNHLVSRINKKRSVSHTIDVVIGNVLDQHSAYDAKIKNSLILLVFAVFSFYTCFYFCTMIQTEMVVQKKPVTISSYADIVNNQKVKPVWAKGLNDHWDFMNAQPGTMESKVWNKAKRFGIANCRVEGDLRALISYGIDVGKGNSVFLGAGYVMDLVITNACYLSRKYATMMDANAWLRSDPNAKETLNGFMRTTALSEERGRRMAKTGKALFEFHIIKQSIRMLDYVMGKDTGSKELRDCVANVIIYPDHELVLPDLEHYHTLFLLLLACLAASLLVLFIECCRPNVGKFHAIKFLRH